MSPRVLVDATAVPADRGGVGRYVDGLLPALIAAGADLAVACQRADVERYRRLVPQARVISAPLAVMHRPARLAWEQTGLPLVAEQVAAEVIHSPLYTIPLRVSRPVVVTIHDTSWFSEPQGRPSVRGSFYRSAIRTSSRRATRVVVPSKAIREELVRLVDADPDRVDVAYRGVDTAVFHQPSEAERARVSNRLGLHGTPYIAFLGPLEHRKGVPALVTAWVEAVRGRPDPPALVLAGAPGDDDDVDRAVAAVPPPLRLVRPGYLHVEDLPGFLGGALVVAYPSSGEGFGLPVLEAMACGAPVLTARRLSLPEVGGDAVAYTEPDPDAIAVALRGLLDDDAGRARLADAGRARALQFPWSASAEAHLATYARAISEHARRLAEQAVVD